MNDNNWYGKEIIIDEDVAYIGEGLNPKDDPYLQAWEHAIKKVYKKESEKECQ